MASKTSAISCALYFSVPLKSRCSMKWETPARSSRSSRDPAPIQKPSATDRTWVSRSVTTRWPESSSERTYFCTDGSYSRRSAEPLGAFHPPSKPIGLATAASEESDEPLCAGDAIRYALWRLGQAARFTLAVPSTRGEAWRGMAERGEARHGKSEGRNDPPLTRCSCSLVLVTGRRSPCR